MSTTVRFAASIEVTRATTWSSASPSGISRFGIRTWAGISAKRSSTLRTPIAESISSSSEGMRSALSEQRLLRVWPGPAPSKRKCDVPRFGLRGTMLPVVLVSIFLAMCGVWWGLTVIAWITWEKRFASPAQSADSLQDTEKKPSWKSKLVDAIEFGAPTVLAVGLAVDGFAGRALMHAAGWSIPVPVSEGLQIVGT